MSRAHKRQKQRTPAFTLLEVVVAVSIFAVGMVGIVALFTPVARSVNNSADAEAAARVADALRVKLQTMPINEVLALLKKSTGVNRHELTDADQRSDYNPTADAQILFANRDGSKIGVNSSSIWIASGQNQNVEKYFEIALIRNEAISPLPESPTEDVPDPPVPDSTAPAIAYIARLRWPVFVRQTATTTTAAVAPSDTAGGLVRYDHSLKQSLFFTGAVQR